MQCGTGEVLLCAREVYRDKKRNDRREEVVSFRAHVPYSRRVDCSKEMCWRCTNYSVLAPERLLLILLVLMPASSSSTKIGLQRLRPNVRTIGKESYWWWCQGIDGDADALWLAGALIIVTFMAIHYLSRSFWLPQYSYFYYTLIVGQAHFCHPVNERFAPFKILRHVAARVFVLLFCLL